VILRPGGVYGPRDTEFLRLFKAARARFTPVFGGGRQELTLVFATDLADVAVRALAVPAAGRRVFNTVSSEVVTAAALTDAVTREMGRRTLRLSLPGATLSVVCGLFALWARISRQPTVLAHGKQHELRAPGWVADTTQLRAALGSVCATDLRTGLAATAAWYRQQGWL
jgi:nucleoside-diphosphate-sugar epimerase